MPTRFGFQHSSRKQVHVDGASSSDEEPRPLKSLQMAKGNVLFCPILLFCHFALCLLLFSKCICFNLLVMQYLELREMLRGNLMAHHILIPKVSNFTNNYGLFMLLIFLLTYLFLSFSLLGNSDADDEISVVKKGRKKTIGMQWSLFLLVYLLKFNYFWFYKMFGTLL